MVRMHLGTTARARPIQRYVLKNKAFVELNTGNSVWRAGPLRLMTVAEDVGGGESCANNRSSAAYATNL
jgi:hypothetical protein